MYHLIKKTNKSTGENLLIEKRVKKIEKTVEQLDIEVGKLKILTSNKDFNDIIDVPKDSVNVDTKPDVTLPETPTVKPDNPTPDIPGELPDTGEIGGLDNI